MLKIQIEVELADGEYCNGCPCMDMEYNGCNYFLNDNMKRDKNNKVIRLDICKQQNKEVNNGQRTSIERN